MKAEQIAHVVHEANRALCEGQGDHSQVDWKEAPSWQQTSALNGVKGILDGHITKPEQSHESWLAEKKATGWKFGPVKDVALKEHPCYVPYKDLPPAQQVKDAIFFAVVKACQPYVDKPTEEEVRAEEALKAEHAARTQEGLHPPVHQPVVVRDKPLVKGSNA